MSHFAVPDPYTLEDLRRWKPDRAGEKPVRLGVIGRPVAHSLSPRMQNAALEEAGLPARYAAFDLGEEELEEGLALFRKHEFIGLNVTVPHKVAVVPLLDEVAESARQIGAVNTIVFAGEKATGHNTDGSGFERAVRREFAVDLRDLRVLLLGAGGAARAFAWQCARAGCERLVIANRTREKAAALTAELGAFFQGQRLLGPVARLEAIGLEERALRLQLEHVDLVVNATPLGLHRSDPSPLPASLLAPSLLILDTTYGSFPNALQRAAAEVGARAVNGLSLLLEQGAEAFGLWFDREAPVAAMRRALEEKT